MPFKKLQLQTSQEPINYNSGMLRLTTFCWFSSAAPAHNKMRLPSFSHFPLHSSINSFLEAKDIHTPTFIQYALLSAYHTKNNEKIQHIVSPTGTGKTLAYMLPIVDSLKKEEEITDTILTKSQRPRALIITSGKQLVLQGRSVAKDISHYSKLRCEGLGIGRNLVQERQKLQDGVDILITPFVRFKRMLDHREAFLSNLKWIVVDQVDTIFQSQFSMTESIFSTIITPKMDNPQQGRQIPHLILSSTTNPLPLRDYLKKKLPKMEQIVDKNTHINLENIRHEFLHCQELNKHQLLLQEVKRDRKGKIIVFCNTIKSLHDLEYFLAQEAIQVTTLHSQLNKTMRLANYENFRDAEKGILLATDLGARGLDFPRLKRIINYDFPLTTCDYLQRAGRTGRAQTKGTVVSLYFKKHLDIINELKGASFKEPLKIKNSAYGFKNRQETKKPSKFSKK